MASMFCDKNADCCGGTCTNGVCGCPGTLLAQVSSVMRMPPVPRTVPSSLSVMGYLLVKGSSPTRS